MRVEEATPVVLRLIAERGDSADLDCDLLHLPKPLDPNDGAWGGHRQALDTYVEKGQLPLTWRSLCGLTGWAYHWAGCLRDTRFCTACVAAANKETSREWRVERLERRQHLSVAA